MQHFMYVRNQFCSGMRAHSFHQILQGNPKYVKNHWAGFVGRPVKTPVGQGSVWVLAENGSDLGVFRRRL